MIPFSLSVTSSNTYLNRPSAISTLGTTLAAGGRPSLAVALAACAISFFIRATFFWSSALVVNSAVSVLVESTIEDSTGGELSMLAALVELMRRHVRRDRSLRKVLPLLVADFLRHSPRTVVATAVRVLTIACLSDMHGRPGRYSNNERSRYRNRHPKLTVFLCVCVCIFL